MGIDDLDLQSRLQPLQPPKPTQSPGSVKQGKPGSAPKTSFSDVLAGQLAEKTKAPPAQPAFGVEFSAHALARLKERNITLSSDDLARLGKGVQLAESKGSKNALILMDDTAFIVSVKNNKVITAVPKESAVDNVFTQIDSAAIV